MGRPAISKLEHLRRIEQAIARKQDAADTVYDRIRRGGYSIHSPEGRAIRRKYNRMVDKILQMTAEMVKVRETLQD